MNNPWCESCARKNNCYTLSIRPKCFMPITNSERVAEPTDWKDEMYAEAVQTEPTDDECKGCIYDNGKNLMACVNCKGKQIEPKEKCNRVDADCENCWKQLHCRAEPKACDTHFEESKRKILEILDNSDVTYGDLFKALIEALADAKGEE